MCLYIYIYIFVCISTLRCYCLSITYTYYIKVVQSLFRLNICLPGVRAYTSTPIVGTNTKHELCCCIAGYEWRVTAAACKALTSPTRKGT